MYKKICPYCHRSSYSAAKESKWVCSTCGQDITYIQTEEEKRGEAMEDKNKKSSTV